MLRLLLSSFLFVFASLAAQALPPAELLNTPISELEQLEKSKEDLPQKVFVEVTADEVTYNQNSSVYHAKGNAEAFLPDKNATLYADEMIYNGTSSLVEAFGDVRIVEENPNGLNNEIQGTYTSFKLGSSEIEFDEPRVYVKGIKMKARVAKAEMLSDDEGKKKYTKVRFEDGIASVDQPISIYQKGFRANTRYSQDRVRQARHRQLDWQDLPEKPFFKYTAEEISFDETKKVNNLRITGARAWLSENFSIPAPINITATVGEAAETRFNGPIFGNQNRLGGFVLGPRFYHARSFGTFALAPVVQIGDGADFGGGAILSFNTPGDTTTLMGGYGSLEDRWIVNAHQKLPLGFELNYLKNQFINRSMFGASQVGEYAEIAHNANIKGLPFIDRRGIRLHNAFGYAKDNDDLFSPRRLEDLRDARSGSPDKVGKEDYDDMRSAHNLSFYSKPALRFGNELYNFSLSARAQAALRAYGSGDIYSIARFGPSAEIRLSKLSFEIAYLFATVGGESPFIFDQFVEGRQSIMIDGDYAINDWISLGTFLAYNIDDDRFTRNQMRAAFGPEDFKLIVSYDSIRNQIGLGFGMMLGEAVEFDQLDVRM